MHFLFYGYIDRIECNTNSFFNQKLGAQSLAGEAGGAEGVLTRKHDWESTTKKAGTRSWDKVRLLHSLSTRQR